MRFEKGLQELPFLAWRHRCDARRPRKRRDLLVTPHENEIERRLDSAPTSSPHASGGLPFFLCSPVRSLVRLFTSFFTFFANATHETASRSDCRAYLLHIGCLRRERLIKRDRERPPWRNCSSFWPRRRRLDESLTRRLHRDESRATPSTRYTHRPLGPGGAAADASIRRAPSDRARRHDAVQPGPRVLLAHVHGGVQMAG